MCGSKSESKTTTEQISKDQKIVAEQEAFVIGPEAMVSLYQDFSPSVQKAFGDIVEASEGLAQVAFETVGDALKAVSKSTADVKEIAASSAKQITDIKDKQSLDVKDFIPYIAIGAAAIIGLAFIVRK
jgi:hypothetical protein